MYTTLFHDLCVQKMLNPLKNIKAVSFKVNAATRHVSLIQYIDV